MKTSILFLLLLTGCAFPHRTSLTRHEHREFTGRTDGKVSEDVWTDRAGGGGVFLLTTSGVQSLSDSHTNQTALGGGSAFASGPITITGDPSTVRALGSAIGEVVGEAVKASVGNPLP